MRVKQKVSVFEICTEDARLSERVLRSCKRGPSEAGVNGSSEVRLFNEGEQKKPVSEPFR
jgi:hypothetical protein